MDEAKIAAEVAKNIPQEEHVPAPEVVDNTADDPISHTPIDIDDPVLNQRLSDYFELPRMSKYTEETQRHVKAVLGWADQLSGTGDPLDILMVIQRVERELGIINKPNRLARIYRFVKLQEQSVMMDKEMELLRG